VQQGRDGCDPMAEKAVLRSFLSKQHGTKEKKPQEPSPESTFRAQRDNKGFVDIDARPRAGRSPKTSQKRGEAEGLPKGAPVPREHKKVVDPRRKKKTRGKELLNLLSRGEERKMLKRRPTEEPTLGNLLRKKDNSSSSGLSRSR